MAVPPLSPVPTPMARARMANRSHADPRVTSRHQKGIAPVRFYFCKPSEQTQPKPFSAPAAPNPAEWNVSGACVIQSTFSNSTGGKLSCLATRCVDTARDALAEDCGVESLRLTRSKQNFEQPTIHSLAGSGELAELGWVKVPSG